MHDPAVTLKHVTDSIVELEYCPGDMTRYHAVVCKVGHPETWVVSFPDFGSSYYVTWGGNDDVHLHPSYVAEKWLVNGRRANEHTAKMMAVAISAAFEALGHSL